MPNPLWRLAGGALLLAACTTHQFRMPELPSSLAESVSLLGDTLWSIPLDPGTGPARVGRLLAAREAVERDSSNLNAWVRLGRNTNAMGQFRETVGMWTRLAFAHFNDPRVFRERGEALLWLRELDQAVADLRRAGLLSLTRGPLVEHSVEPNGLRGDSASGNRISTMVYHIDFLLGFALYLKGDYKAAYTALAEAAQAALTTDDRTRAILWFFLALRRSGDAPGDLAILLSLVQPEWKESSRYPDIDLLLAFKGLLPSDSIRALALAPGGRTHPLYSYAIAYSLLLQPERRADAELWLSRARSGTNWASLTYLAAEADLARLLGITRRRIVVRPERP